MGSEAGEGGSGPGSGRLPTGAWWGPGGRVSFAWATLANLFLCQPWAFPAREFLRKKLIGKDVCFSVEYKTSPRREYGMVYLGKGERPSLLGLALLWLGLLARVWGGVAFLPGLLGTGQV